METQDGREAHALMTRGVINGLSIGYNVVDSKRTSRGRSLTEIDLWEVSVVTFPANPEALIREAASADDSLDHERLITDMRAFAAECRRNVRDMEIASIAQVCREALGVARRAGNRPRLS